MADLLSINPYALDSHAIRQAAQKITNGGVAVVPTDTVYAIVCGVDDRNAAQKLYRIKGLEANDITKPLSVLCYDLASVSEYTRGMPNSAYRIMRRVLPGPYTFILNASKRIPAAALQGRKTIGIRIPDHPVILALLRELNSPLLATSVVHDDVDSLLDDPVAISVRLGRDVDLVVDAGPIFPEPSTVIDYTSGEAVILRAGKGSIEDI
ncbi:MAG: threonylcarbamoyl-AMP synthase [Myxococcales bacterium]|nr:threonylcarbamoyl-AMP synthase [Myxococcales bacterium]